MSSDNIIRQVAERFKDLPAESNDVDTSLPLSRHKDIWEKKDLQRRHYEAMDIHSLRMIYCGRLFWLIVAWLTSVIIFVLMTGISLPIRAAWPYWENTALGAKFQLSDQVLIAFISSTTVSVLGLFVIVAKWLFGKPKDE